MEFVVIAVPVFYWVFVWALFAVVIWPKRTDCRHVRCMADAFAALAWPQAHGG